MYQFAEEYRKATNWKYDWLVTEKEMEAWEWNAIYLWNQFR